MNSESNPQVPTRGPDAWIPALIAVSLLAALAISTTGEGFAGHSAILWFALLTWTCVRMRGERWVRALYLPALVIFVTWFVGAAPWIAFPFALALLIAYLLDPVIDDLERRMSRTAAIAILAVPMLAVVVLLVVFLIPALFSESAQLVERLPELRQPIERLAGWAQAQAARFGIILDTSSIIEFVAPHLEGIGRNLWGAGEGVWRGVRGVIGFASFMVITPVVAFYLLRDFDRMHDGLLRAIPASGRVGVKTYMEHVDHAVSGYLRGQLLVGVVVGTLFAVGLTLLGMQYALLVGVSALFLNLVPFLGAALTAVLAVAVALLSDPSWMSVLKVMILYTVVSGVEGVVSPRILSGSLALHPVLVLSAVLIGGQFFGIVGVLVAVPTVAVLKEAMVVWGPQLLELLPIDRHVDAE